MGLFGYYRGFIKNFADKVLPLHRGVDEKAKIDDRINERLEDIRKELISSPWLVIPDMSQPIIVEADALNYCLGGVLKQKRESKEITIRCCSRDLNKHELNYSTIKKKTLAIIFATKKVKNYLHKEFIIKTDNKLLVCYIKLKIHRDELRGGSCI